MANQRSIASLAIKHFLLAIAFSLIAFADGRIYQHAKSEFELGSYEVLRINKIEFPAVEHVTVISGTFQIGMGDQFDESKLNPMIAGTFGFLAPKMNHFAMAKGDTVIQLHGIGPWQINYVNPVDDPRKKLFSRFRIKFGQLDVLLQIVNLYSSIRRSRSGRIVHFWIRDARQ